MTDLRLWVEFWGLALFICAHRSSALPRTEGNIVPADSASTLAFVFDVTGSMYDDLKQVIDGASRILEKTLSRRTRPIRNFVLVPFHDPDIGPVSITTDPKKFQQDLQELFVQGGGDCPEMSVGAIKRALEVSLPGSFIYVFTDARAKDYRLKREVLQLVQLRQSQVVFVLTGDCGDRTHPGYRTYEEIAATSSGQIFHLDKQQVNEVLKWVEETVQAMKVHLLSSDHENAQENTWEVPFDPSLKEVTVSLSGPAPLIELSDPLGHSVGESQGLTELLNIPNSARVVNLKNPRPGIWTLKVACGGRHSLRMTGVSSLDFRAGFSSEPVGEFNHTRERPIKGVPAHVLLKCTGLKPPGLVNNMELVSTGGRSLRTLPVPLPGDRGYRGLWAIPEFRTPSQSFFLKVSGKDADGYQFQRLSSVSYTNIIPGKKSNLSEMKGFYMLPAVIGCSVESDVPYRLRFMRSGTMLGEEKFFKSSTSAVWKIPQASGKDEGPYECIALSSAGMGRAVTQLTPSPVLKPAVNVTSSPGAVAVLSCQVEGSMSYNLSWHRAGTTLTSRSGRVRLLPNSSLEISGVLAQDAGPYHCMASNAHGDNRVVVWLLVPEAPTVVVSPPTQMFTLGAEVRISCMASGSPHPQIFWSYGNIFLTNRHRMTITEHGTLIIRQAVPGDAGNYTCLATNEAGTTSKYATLSFSERPSVSASQQTVLVVVGGDAVLQCMATGVPPPLVHWYKGKCTFNLDSFMPTPKIKSVQERDAGEYRCVAQSPAGTASATVILQVGAFPQFSESPVDVAVNVGENVTLPCAAHGFPVATVTWGRKDGRAIFSKPGSPGGALQLPSGALVIQSVWLDHEGLYICEARNHFGSIRTEARITVTGLGTSHGGPMANTWSFKRIVKRSSGGCCCVSCCPLNSRTFLRSDGGLHVDRAASEDAGKYVCTAVNLAGSANVSVTLEVNVPPEILPGPLQYIANEGAAISLSCEAAGVPQPTVVWSKVETLSRDGPTLRSDPDGQLHILNPAAEDAGVYVCTATSSAGYASREIQLSVNTKPRTVGANDYRKPLKISAEVGSEVILPCEVQGSPTPVVTWSRNGHPIPPVTAWFTVLPSGALKITDVRLIDSKLYTCLAANPAGNVSITYNLQVQSKPRIQAAPALLKALIGQTVVLQCVTQGEPRPELTWFHDGHVVGHESSFKIQAAAYTDRGTYSCVAQNNAGQDTLETILEVLEAPYFEDPGEIVMERVVNSKVVIPCHAKGSPQPKVRWFKNGLEIHLDRPELGLTISPDGALVIVSASANRSGDFKCVATNEAGSVERKTRLKINVPPEIQDDGHSVLSVVLGFPTLLTCDVEGSPQPSITWLKDNQVIVSSAQLPSFCSGSVLSEVSFVLCILSIHKVPKSIIKSIHVVLNGLILKIREYFLLITTVITTALIM
uniref:Ig-like domain-containing protein n=1 Tax=Denticeps clupeoides TaxID=299321 RepID=A0AAY4EVD3_9TELE